MAWCGREAWVMPELVEYERVGGWFDIVAVSAGVGGISDDGLVG